LLIKMLRDLGLNREAIDEGQNHGD
jgi:hypothetical protein